MTSEVMARWFVTYADIPHRTTLNGRWGIAMLGLMWTVLDDLGVKQNPQRAFGGVSVVV